MDHNFTITVSIPINKSFLKLDIESIQIVKYWVFFNDKLYKMQIFLNVMRNTHPYVHVCIQFSYTLLKYYLILNNLVTDVVV